MPKLQKMKSGQIFITVPRELGKALGFEKGDNFRFVINQRGRIELVKVG